MGDSAIKSVSRPQPLVTSPKSDYLQLFLDKVTKQLK